VAPVTEEERLVAALADFVDEASERLLAVVTTPDPRWYRPLSCVLAVLPGTGRLSERLDNWRHERALRLYRSRPAS
jgi:hypothetical protein